MQANRLIFCNILLATLLSSGGVWSEPAATHTNSIGMELVLIPSGSFTMGSDKDLDRDTGDHETPPHQVTISTPFYLGKYEVTQAQWLAVMGRNPGFFKGHLSLPVEQVNWQDAHDFIQALNAREGSNAYRLPTEAEWEYAARGGTDTIRHWGDDLAMMGQYAWFYDNSDHKTHPVGQLKPNAWGLHDMLGNVWEWVSDWYEARYYVQSPDTDPTGPDSGSLRVVRGSYWDGTPTCVRSAFRRSFEPGFRTDGVGFRIVRTIR